MTAVNIEKRKIFKRRRDGQVAQGGSVSVSVSSGPSSSEGEFNPAILQDYAKKVDVHAPSQKALLDALSVEAGYIKYQAAALSVDNADKLGGVVAASYARRDAVNTYEYDQTINADLYVNGNIIQNGSAYETHAEHLNVENNLMQLNVGEPGSQITGVIPGTAIPFSGIEINRGTGEAYYMGVVEGETPLLKLGKKDSLVAIAAREDSPSSGGVMVWDDPSKQMKATKDLSLTSISTELYGNTSNWKEAYDHQAMVHRYTGAVDNGWYEISIHDNESSVSDFYAQYKSGENWYKLRAGYADNSPKLANIAASNYARTDINETFNGKVWIGGQIADSAAMLQVNGFMRTGNIYLHTGGNTPNTDRSNDYLSNDDGSLKWRSSTVWTALNSDISTKDWQGRDLTAHRNLFVVGDSDLQSDVFVHGHIGSPSYVSGIGGKGTWRISLDANAEFDNLDIREGLTCNTFTNNQINISNGDLIVSDHGEVFVLHPNGDRFYTSAETPFRIGDILRCQGSKQAGNIKSYYLTVANIIDSTVQFDENGNARNIIVFNNKTGDDIEVGDVIVRWNSSEANRKGLLYLSSSSTYAPFYDVVYDGKTVSRFGNLEGITSSVFKNLEGYGFWTQNGYLEGGINATFGNVANWSIEDESITKRFGDFDTTIGVQEGTSIRGFHVYQYNSSTGNRVSTGWLNNDNWGIWGTINGDNIFRLGSDNKIAGMKFDKEKFTAGNVQIWKTGDILNTASGTPYAFYGNGNFSLGKGQIGYNAATNVLSFGSGVTLTWNQITETSAITNGITTAQQTANNAYDLADEANDLAATKITSIQATTITQNTVTAPYIAALNLEVGNQIAMGANATISWGEVTDVQMNTMNLLNNSAFKNQGYSSGRATVTYIGDTVKIKRESSNVSDCYFAIAKTIPEEYVGKKLTFSCEFSADWNINMKLRARTGDDNTWSNTLTVNDGDRRKMFSITFIPTGASVTLFVYSFSTVDLTMHDGFQLTQGSKPASWSRSLSDVDTNVTTITKTTIQTTNLLAENLKVNFVNVQGTLSANQIDALSITGDKIAAGTITTTKLAANTITAEKIATGTITADKLNTASVQASLITTDYIEGLELNFNKGTIGSWTINENELSGNGGAGSSIIKPSRIFVGNSDAGGRAITGIATNNINTSYGIEGIHGDAVEFPSNFKGGVLGYASYSGSYAVIGFAKFNTGAKAGYFNGIVDINGALNVDGAVILKTIRTSLTNYYCDDNSHTIVCTIGNNVYLPSSPENGREIRIKRDGTGEPTIKGNGKTIKYHSNVGVSELRLNATWGQAVILQYDGIYWQVMGDIF